MEPEIGLTLELRVLHGPQAGSRLQLGIGEYLLGSADECTIILAGPRIEEEHAVIVFDGEEIAIRPVNGSVNDAQGNDIEAETVLALGLPVELGGVWLSVDRIEAPWPAAEAVGPLPRGLRGSRDAASPDDVSANASSHIDADANLSADQQVEALLQQAESEEQARGAKLERSPPADAHPWWLRLRRRLPRIRWRGASAVLAMLACAVSLGVMVAGWFGNGDAPREIIDPPEFVQPAVVPPVPPPALLALILKQGLGDRVKVVAESGEWVVQGYLPGAAARIALVEGFSDMEQRPLLRIINEEELVADANRFLARRNNSTTLLLRAENIGHGAIRMTGAAATEELANSAAEALRAGVAGITRVESSVLLPERLVLKLREKLSAVGLTSQIKTIEERPELVLRGTLTAEETARWEAVLVEFARTYGSVLAIRANIGRVRPRLPVNVQTIVGGRTPYIVTESGDKVNTGGDINGHTLLMVRDAEVVFEGSKRVRMAR